ncbi:hypothetical protein DXV76_08785 [Rhodobacteraceae bacterium CCMM004]|nr:hypothetical protein DXV76_08785 [Rhodobacteraceae bacterium CCMM004]
MSDVVTGADLSRDHSGIADTFAARRYFAKFDAITQHLGRVAGEMEQSGALSRTEVGVVADYVTGIAATFRALGTKYLLTGRDTGRFLGSLAIDVTESGFPVFRELLTMASDAQQAQTHLEGTEDRDRLIERMVEDIIVRQQIPTRLQFALSQRLYYQALAEGGLFWARNDPRPIWLSGLNDRRTFLLHWAVYDSEINLPVIYLMTLEDSGRTSLPKDPVRWPQVQGHLMAQAVAGLKLLTIAKGFDTDFADLHPKMLRRIHVGPMYSSAFTLQAGPIRRVLEEARAPKGEDWCLAWTVEELESARTERASSGWFGSVERQVFALDPMSGRAADTGATRTSRSIILPQRPFQVLAELDPPGFRSVTKYVVSPGGRVLTYR